LFVLLFGITSSALCTWTQHHGVILLDLQDGTFLEKEEEKEEEEKEDEKEDKEG